MVTVLAVGSILGRDAITKVVWDEWTSLTWVSWVMAALLLTTLALILVPAARIPSSPTWWRISVWILVAGWLGLVVTRLVLEATIFEVAPGEAPPWDRRPWDPWWTTIHFLTGVVLGAFELPLTLVVVAIVSWEALEIIVPGFGDQELNENRMYDLVVALIGWLVAAFVTTRCRKSALPGGLRASDYLDGRLYGKWLVQ